MSTWYEVANEDIDIDHKEKEVSFLVCTDNCGVFPTRVGMNR